jgi:hypothetical protein
MYAISPALTRTIVVAAGKQNDDNEIEQGDNSQIAPASFIILAVLQGEGILRRRDFDQTSH